MWMLSWIPDSFLIWVINLVLLAGVIGTTSSVLFKLVIRYFAWFIPYRLILQLVSVILLIIGVYLRGGYSVEADWRARVAELEAKVAASEKQSKEANVQIQKVYVDRVKVVKEKQIVIQEKLKTVEVKIDANCKVVPEAISILNEAAVGVKK